jgi:DNA-binding transcriptional LysR family regulator
MSRRLADLEQRLGYRLFQRKVEGAVLTSAGKRLLGPARKMAEWAGEVARAAGQEETGGAQGMVRVTAPPSVAFDFVAPLAVKLREKLPEIRLEVLSTPHYLDLARGEADLAIRYFAPSSRDLVSVGRLTMPNAVVVASSYAARLKKKPRLEDLDWIAWAPPFEDLAPNPELAAVVPDFRPVFTSDNYLVQWRACEAGVGAMLRGHHFSFPSPVIALDIDLGPHATSTLHLVCARSALAVPRIRAVADLVLAAFRAEEGR